MPRVVDSQRNKFETEDFFQKYSKECEIRYAWPKDRQTIEDKLSRLQTDCREGHLHIAFTTCGTNLPLRFPSEENSPPLKEYVDFEREPGKLHFMSRFILNGVCVRFIGTIDLNRFEGMGKLEFDEENAQKEDKLSREMVDSLMPSQLPPSHFQPGPEPGQGMWPPQGQDGQPAPHMDSKPVLGPFVHGPVPLHSTS